MTCWRHIQKIRRKKSFSFFFLTAAECCGLGLNVEILTLFFCLLLERKWCVCSPCFLSFFSPRAYEWADGRLFEHFIVRIRYDENIYEKLGWKLILMRESVSNRWIFCCWNFWIFRLISWMQFCCWIIRIVTILNSGRRFKLIE